MDLVKRIRPDLPILITATHIDDEFFMEALALGARGCIGEESLRDNFLKAIRTVKDGLVWAPRRVIGKFIERHAVLPTGGGGKVTDREGEILGLLLSGRSNREIARPLGIKTRTVKSHLSAMMRKLGVRNRIELSSYAIRHSELIPEPYQG